MSAAVTSRPGTSWSWRNRRRSSRARTRTHRPSCTCRAPSTQRWAALMGIRTRRRPSPQRIHTPLLRHSGRGDCSLRGTQGDHRPRHPTRAHTRTPRRGTGRGRCSDRGKCLARTRHPPSRGCSGTRRARTLHAPAPHGSRVQIPAESGRDTSRPRSQERGSRRRNGRFQARSARGLRRASARTHLRSSRCQPSPAHTCTRRRPSAPASTCRVPSSA